MVSATIVYDLAGLAVKEPLVTAADVADWAAGNGGKGHCVMNMIYESTNDVDDEPGGRTEPKGAESAKDRAGDVVCREVDR